jgi:sigma-B regulation protein RsbU (phosphoserine phosphatase)
MPATSLTARLVLLLTACISLTLLVTTTVDYQVSKHRLLQEVEAQAEDTVAEAVRDLEVRLTSLEESTEFLAEVVQQREFSEAQLLELLREAVDEREDLFGAALALDPRWSSDPQTGFAPYFYYRDGLVKYTDLTDSYDYVASDWFSEAASAGKPVWSEPYFDAGGGNAYMSTYSVPIFRQVNGEQVFYGVITADITLSELQYYLDRMDLGPSGFGFLLSTRGNVMAAPSPDSLSQPMMEVLPQGQDLALWERLLEAVDSDKPASAVIPCAGTAGRCIIKLAPLKTTRWPVGAYYLEDEMLAPLRAYLLKTAVSTAITLVLLMLGVLWVSRRITEPLRALAVATIDISTGNFHTPLPRARSRDELGRLVHAFSIMQANLQSYVSQLEEETASRNRMQGELNAATEIQMSMLPAGGKAYMEEKQYALWAALRPAKSVGGDLYAVHTQGQQRLFIAVGDVSDKGVPAAIFMARAMTLLQQYARDGLAATTILARLNNDLVEGNDNCMFVTLFAGWLDLDTLRLSFASGGHTPPSLRRGSVCHSIEQEEGPALGLSENLEFPYNQLQLQPADLLAIFTDGVDEAFSQQHVQFGIDNFNQLLLTGADKPLQQLGPATFAAVDEHAQGVAQSDDITIMLLQLPTSQSLTLAADHTAVRTLADWLQTELAAAQVENAICSDLQLVSEEVITNIIKYAQLPAQERVLVKLEIGESLLTLHFQDSGIAFNPLTEARRAELGADTSAAEIGGLGVHLLLALTDQQEYTRQDQLNCLCLYKQRQVIN